MRLRPVGLFALILVLALDASAAARRRSVRAPGGSAPNTGNCITYGSPRIGMKASYLTTSAQGNVTFTVIYVSETPTQARTTQKVQTPQGSSDAETRMDFETVPASFDLRALKHLYVKSTTVAAGFPITIETDIDFVPSMVLGPASGWCVGAKWTVPSTTQTIQVRSFAGPQTTTQTTTSSEGEVLAIEDVTTPAGTFRCLKYRGMTASANGASRTIAWNSVEHYITVRQEEVDANGNVTQVTTLQKIE